MYDNNDGEGEDEFMPHSWKQSVGEVQKVEHPMLGAYVDDNEEEEEYEEEEEEVGYEPPHAAPEPVTAPAQVPVMPMDYYNKVENFLTTAPPVLIGGDGDKKSTVEKLPTIGGNKKPPSDSSSAPRAAGARDKIKKSISASKQPLDTDLLQQAFKYTDMLSQQEQEEQTETAMKGAQGSTKAGRKGKKVSPEKEPPRRRVQQDMEAAYGVDMDRNPFSDGFAEAAAQDRRRKKGAREESSDDLYTNLMHGQTQGQGGGQAPGGGQRMGGSKSSGSMGVSKKSHPYLDSASTKQKSKSMKMKSSGKNKTGGAVNRLRDELVANTFNGSHGSASGGAFSNYNSHETTSSLNRDRELTRNNASTTEGFDSLIENFTKGLTLNKLRQELEDSQKSLDRSNAFMDQAMGRK